MKRDEALSFLKAVLNESPNMSPEAITLNQRDESNDYTVDIKETLPSQTVRAIALKHNLSVKEERDIIVVYKPTA